MNSEFQSLARSVGSARDNIISAGLTITAALGTATLTWYTLVSLLVAGGTIGAAAIVIWDNSSTGKSYMKQAYNLKFN